MLTYVATFEPTACALPLPDGQDPTHITCGYLSVPENRAHPGRRTIKIAVTVLHTTGATAEPDPFVFLSGGPGAWAIDNYLSLFTADFAAPIQSKRDIVIFEQRGTGRSQPALNCPEVLAQRDSYTEALTPGQEAERDARNYLAYRDRLVQEGNDLTGYTSAETAQDIADLMNALGYERFNLYGLSYGTRVALTTLRDLPNAAIRSVVLDSTVPLQSRATGAGVGSVNRSFNLLFAACADDPACDRAFPNLRQTAFDLVARLNASPLSLDPVDANGQPFHVVYTGDRAIRITGSAFQVASLIPLIPFAISSTANGNTALITAGLSLIGAPELYSPGLQATMLCNEEIPFITPELIAMENAGANPLIVHAFSADGLLLACPQWGSPAPEPRENEPVHSDVPALILAGEYDTATPPNYGQLAAETLPNSYFFELRGYGHVELFQQYAPTGPPSCAMQLIAQFIDDPTREPDGSCVAAIPPPHFVGS